MSPTLMELREASRLRSAKDGDGTIAAFYPFWDAQYRPYLLLALDRLPREQFGFKPRPEMLTAHQIVLHIAETERGWMNHVVGGGPDEEWVIPHEDKAQGWVTVFDAPDHDALRAVLEREHRLTQGWFARPASELSRVITHQRPDGPVRRFTLHWILDHLEEHEIHHRAQLNLYLRLMGIEPPSI